MAAGHREVDRLVEHGFHIEKLFKQTQNKSNRKNIYIYIYIYIYKHQLVLISFLHWLLHGRNRLQIIYDATQVYSIKTKHVPRQDKDYKN